MTQVNRITSSGYSIPQKVGKDAEYLYMFIDAAHDPRIYPAIANSIHTRCCLFSEEHIADEVKAVSPFLVKIKRFDDFVSWCLREGLHRNWMTFFSSTEVHVSELRLHFKRFSIASTPDGKRYFFRYHDPRILPAFLAASDPGDRLEFFGPCRAIWVPQISQTNDVELLEIRADGRQSLLQNPTHMFATTRMALV